LLRRNCRERERNEFSDEYKLEFGPMADVPHVPRRRPEAAPSYAPAAAARGIGCPY